MKLCYLVFFMCCVVSGIVLAICANAARAASYCHVSTGWRQDLPGWTVCPADGQFLVGTFPGGTTCATPDVVCE